MKVIKKLGIEEDFDFTKIITAVTKSADRCGGTLTKENIKDLETKISIALEGRKQIDVIALHQLVETSLSGINIFIADSYRSYRNYKKEMSEMMEDVVVEIKKSFEERDRSNSNGNSVLFQSRRVNASKVLLTKMFEKYFLTQEQRQACSDGYIYVHDKDNRPIGTHNCCVVNLSNVIDGGFNINGFFCKEPKDIVNAVGVMGDIIVSSASAQYGGYTVANIDYTLKKYCEKSYIKWKEYYNTLGIDSDASAEAYATVQEELENALQALEFQLNTRESARGDYPFITFTFGHDTSFWGRKVSETLLRVRMKGHGDTVKQSVIFPKLVMRLRDDKFNDDIFDLAVRCNVKAIYPDYIPEEKVSPMGR